MYWAYTQCGQWWPHCAQILAGNYLQYGLLIRNDFLNYLSVLGKNSLFYIKNLHSDVKLIESYILELKNTHCGTPTLTAGKLILAMILYGENFLKSYVDILPNN